MNTAILLTVGVDGDDLGACASCGKGLLARVICFARCGGCGAENYRPLPGSEPERYVARFWGRGRMARPRLALRSASFAQAGVPL